MAAGHACRAQVATDRIRHRRRPTEKYIALARVGDELAHMLRRQQGGSLDPVVADDVVNGEAELRGELVELLLEDEIRTGHDPIEDDDVAAHALHERPNRRDANAAG